MGYSSAGYRNHHRISEVYIKGSHVYGLPDKLDLYPVLENGLSLPGQHHVRKLQL